MNYVKQSIPQFCPSLGQAEIDAVAACIERNWITEGPQAEKFVDGLLELTGARAGVLAPNGTLALAMALEAVGVGDGDEVLVPDFTFIGSSNAIIQVGAVPVFVDVDPRTLQIDVASCRAALGPKTKAIMPVHIYGSSCDMDAVMDFARHHGLKVVEDAAQGIGVFFKGRHVGTFGDAGCFSFFADKCITTGEGGFVATNDESVAHRLKMIRNQGRLERGSFKHEEIGSNFRMTDLQAAIGVQQLSRLSEIVQRKIDIHERYRDNLSDLRAVDFLEIVENSTQVPFRSVILVPEAERLIAYLTGCGVQPRGGFYPLHLQTCYRDQGFRRSPDLRHSLEAFVRAVCLPSWVGLTDDEVDYVSGQVRAFFA